MKISIIVPVYKVEDYISECIQSIMKQTYKEEIECIIVDDCTPDRSIKIATGLIAQYKGNISFKIIKHKKNAGLSVARNTGIKESTGDYLFFIDSDDYITPDCIEQIAKTLQKYPDSDIVQGGIYTTNNSLYWDATNKAPVYIQEHEKIQKLLLKKETYPITVWNKLIKKNFITRYHLLFKPNIIHEDEHWLFFLSKYIQSISICHHNTYYYRTTRKGSIIYNNRLSNQSSESWDIIINDFMNYLGPNGQNEEIHFIIKQLHKLIILTNSNPYKRTFNIRLKTISKRCNFYGKVFTFIVVYFPHIINYRSFVYQLLDNFLLNRIKIKM